MTTDHEAEINFVKQHFGKSCQINVNFFDVYGDGNCVFRVLAKHLLNEDRRHRIIRYQTINYLKKHCRHFSIAQWGTNSSGPNSFEDELNSLFYNGAFAGMETLIGAASLYGLTIYAWYLQESNEERPISLRRICNNKTGTYFIFIL